MKSKHVEQLFLQWSDQRSDVVATVELILDDPEEAVRLQIFRTPALVVENEVLGIDIRSAETLQKLLDQIQCPKSDSPNGESSL